jgi:cystathionine beta-lyase/cystathionine gamma-synthase
MIQDSAPPFKEQTMSKKPETISAQTTRTPMANEPLALPIYQTSTFRFGSIEALESYLKGDERQFLYTRYENPTLRAVEEKIAQLEKGARCHVYSSGMAAITSSLLAVLQAGDEVVASDSLYGRTQFFLQLWLPRFGISSKLVPLVEFPDIDRYLSARTRIVYIESPTNPTLQVIDIRKTAETAHRHGALLFIDNTFATPVNQNPIDLGADVVLHSLTKYIAGHSDIVAGASVFPETHAIAMREAMRTFGGTMDPFAAYLLERGMKTLPLRVRQQNRTAAYLAEKLEGCPAVSRVNYPGLKSHPMHNVAASQMSGFGGMLSFDVSGIDAARRFVERVQIVNHAASLGGVESLVSLPILTSHYGQPVENLKAAGISEGTIRLSVGLESHEDLWDDIEQALK